MTADLDRLEALALAATQDPWDSVPVMLAGRSGNMAWGESTGRLINGPPQTIERDTQSARWFTRKEDADYIVAAHPTVVRNLITRIRNLMAAGDMVEESLDRAIQHQADLRSQLQRVTAERDQLLARTKPPEDPDSIYLSVPGNTCRRKDPGGIVTVERRQRAPDRGPLQPLPLNLPESLDLPQTKTVGAAFYNFSDADRFEVKGRGTVFTVKNPVDTQDFSELMGLDVIINREVWRVKGVQRYAHSPPWRKGESIGLLVDAVPADLPDSEGGHHD